MNHKKNLIRSLITGLLSMITIFVAYGMNEMIIISNFIVIFVLTWAGGIIVGKWYDIKEKWKKNI
ncbi:MAG: hypothetical protein KKF56_05350 [Nanoarchaeota archaeon]|nr:hypothetical protein [Nanoarchaeota archaeon]